MEVSHVRKQLLDVMERVRKLAQEKRQRAVAIEKAYAGFLADVATPIVRQLAAALKAEGHRFTVSTPGGSVRLASERTRDDYIELTLDGTLDPPNVIIRTSRTRGSRTLAEERSIKPGAPPDTITEQEVLSFFLKALEPWLER